MERLGLEPRMPEAAELQAAGLPLPERSIKFLYIVKTLMWNAIVLMKIVFQ